MTVDPYPYPGQEIHPRPPPPAYETLIALAEVRAALSAVKEGLHHTELSLNEQREAIKGTVTANKWLVLALVVLAGAERALALIP